MSKNKPIKTNRVKLLEVSAQVIAEICKKAVQNKLPDDAAVLRISYNPNSNNLEEFPEIPEGSMVPKVDKLPVISDDILK